jgi:hypothetical protein
MLPHIEYMLGLKFRLQVINSGISVDSDASIPSKVSIRNSPSSDSSMSDRVSEIVFSQDISETIPLAWDESVAEQLEYADGGGTK